MKNIEQLEITTKQREIKFRTWNKEEKRMIYFDNLYEFGRFLVTLENSLDSFQNCIFQQYTGLKDKNGKEVYEGDILEFKSNWGGKSEYGQVYWDEYTAGFDWKGNNFGMNFAKGAVMMLEVVGNIYENTKL